LLVRDLGSTHGTYVNGEQVREAYLHSGDHLSVGLATFRVELDDAFCPAGEIGEYSAA
jgi:pSer/pThr/pTyr-binding forkhead associated (FHA) protein